jgi:thiol-disulfide isomerase/thioredoxin
MRSSASDTYTTHLFFIIFVQACKAVAPLYYHLATKYPDVVFVDVPVTNQNSNLHQGLGVPSLPFGHIYHPTAGLVEELQLTRKHLGGFEQSLDSYYTGSCDIPDDADEVSS